MKLSHLKLMTATVAVSFFVQSCTKTPEASFTVDKTTVEEKTDVKFTNTTVNGETYKWDFGDGSTSTEESPTHAFTKVGNLTVTLTAFSKKEKKSATSTKSIVVSDMRDKFVGSFAGSQTMTIGGLSSTDPLTTSITKSSVFSDRILFDSFPYAVISGSNFSIPSQSQNDTDNNGDPVTFNIASGNGVINGTTITFTYTGTYVTVNGTFQLTATATLTKQ